MITKYRFGTPILDTEAVIVPQPVAAAYQPGDAPAFPGMSAAVVDANAQTDGSQGWGPAVQKPRKDAWQFTIELKGRRRRLRPRRGPAGHQQAGLALPQRQPRRHDAHRE